VKHRCSSAVAVRAVIAVVPLSLLFRCRLCAVIAVQAVIAVAVPAGAQAPPASLHAYIEQARRDWNVPGVAVAIVRNDSVIAATGYGVRELGKPDAVDEHTRFDVASLTKSFTAAIGGMLVDAGTMRWDDAAKKHIPELRFPDPYLDREVTLRDLLSHRVGLNPSNWMFIFTGTRDATDVIRRVPFLKPQAPFRTTVVYANYGYTVAGEAMARVAGVPWATMVRTRLLAPLGMRETIVDGPLPATGNVARPHALVGGAQRVLVSEANRMDGPAAGVRSTVSDMARWMRFQMNKGELDGARLVSARAMDEMHSPQVIFPSTEAMRRARLVEFFGGYGLGWQVMDYRGRRMSWHSGSGDGFTSYMAILPNEKIGVIVLTNSWLALNLHSAIVSRVLDVMLGVEPRDWSGEQLRARDAQQAQMRALPQPSAMSGPQLPPTRPFSAYAGRYEHGLYGPIVLAQQGSGLTLQMGSGPIADVHQHSADTLHVQWRDPLLGEMFATMMTFSADARGNVTGLRMLLARDTVTANRAR
jgi:CubicO group peptidase (beta-lactamase class C family)